MASTIVSFQPNTNNGHRRCSTPPTVLASCIDIVQIQSKSLSEKVAWFQSICSQLYGPKSSPSSPTNSTRHSAIHIPIRREYLLQDSMSAVLSMTNPIDLHRTWRIHFTNEDGIDAGGLTREWFHLVSSSLMDVLNGCWCTAKGGGNQMHLQINPSFLLLGGGDGDGDGGSSTGDEYRLYFRFLGRLMGKALVSEQLLSNAHFVPYLYKMMLGWRTRIIIK